MLAIISAVSFSKESDGTTSDTASHRLDAENWVELHHLRDEDPRYRLEGKYRGKTFNWQIDREKLPAMAIYPEDVHFSAEPGRVWITSYYRKRHGATLFDVRTGKGIRGFRGFTFVVSPDGAHVAYQQASIYFSLSAVLVDNIVIYPDEPQVASGNLTMEERAGEEPSDDDAESTRQFQWPQQALAGLEWLTTNTLSFLIEENAYASQAADDPTLSDYWYYVAEGLGRKLDPARISVRRAQLSHVEAERMRDEEPYWLEMAHSANMCDRLRPYSPAEAVSTSTISVGDMVLPGGKRELTVRSPDGRNFLYGLATGFTEYYCEAILFVNGTAVYPDVVTGFDPKSYAGRPKRFGDDYRNAIPTKMDTRLAKMPRWVSNDEVEFDVVEHYIRGVLTGDHSKEQHVRVRVHVRPDGSVTHADVTTTSLQRRGS